MDKKDDPRTPLKQLSSTLDPAASTTMRRLEQTVHVSDTVRGNEKFRATMSYIMATSENPDSPMPMFQQDIVDLSSSEGNSDSDESDVSFESGDEGGAEGSSSSADLGSSSTPTSISTSTTRVHRAHAQPALLVTTPSSGDLPTQGVANLSLASTPPSQRSTNSSYVQTLEDSPSMRYSQKSRFQPGKDGVSSSSSSKDDDQAALLRTGTHPPLSRPAHRQHHHHHHQCKHEETEEAAQKEDASIDMSQGDVVSLSFRC